MANKRWFTGGGRGLTVTEVLIAVIIIAVLASLAIPSFLKAVEQSKDREAQTILRLIRTAERIYRLKYNSFYPNPATGVTSVTDVATINQDLRLNIEPERSWDYSVGSSDGTDFQAQADRLSPPPGYGRSWSVTKDTSTF